jgi:transcriptional regulator with XRE-family HTH domain
MQLSRDTFGPTLKAERDRRGITLQAIADSTKISVSLLAALERNDVSRWPKGIFRRAFLREYVAALGLAPDTFVDEFSRLFPDSPRAEPAEVSEFRLTLEPDASSSWSGLRGRALFSVVEAAGLLVLGAIAGWWFDLPVWVAAGGLALVYYPLANVLLERSSGPRLEFQRLSQRWLRAPRWIGALPQRWSAEPAGAIEAKAEEKAATPPSGEWRPAHH